MKQIFALFLSLFAVSLYAQELPTSRLYDGSHYLNGPQPSQLADVRGFVKLQLFGGEFSTRFFEPRLKEQNGKIVHRDTISYSRFYGCTWRDVADGTGKAIFHGGTNGSLWSGCNFWDCENPVFDFRSNGITSGSNTFNVIESCRFRSKAVAIYSDWTFFTRNSYFEGSHHERVPTKAIVASASYSEHVGDTFERVGDAESVFDFSDGQHVFRACRFGYCPDPEYWFDVGPDTRIVIINPLTTGMFGTRVRSVEDYYRQLEAFNDVEPRYRHRIPLTKNREFDDQVSIVSYLPEETPSVLADEN